MNEHIQPVFSCFSLYTFEKQKPVLKDIPGSSCIVLNGAGNVRAAIQSCAFHRNTVMGQYVYVYTIICHIVALNHYM